MDRKNEKRNGLRAKDCLKAIQQYHRSDLVWGSMIPVLAIVLLVLAVFGNESISKIAAALSATLLIVCAANLYVQVRRAAGRPKAAPAHSDRATIDNHRIDVNRKCRARF